MNLCRGVVIANSMIRLACNPPTAWIRNRQINLAVTATVRTFSLNRVDLRDAIDFEEVKQGIKQNSFIIDVRNRHEVVATGKIPSSINIPLDNIEIALSLPDTDFRKVYNKRKPDVKSQVIFYCQNGTRAMEASYRARKLGYSQPKAYTGSWDDWASRNKEQLIKDKKDPCSSSD